MKKNGGVRWCSDMQILNKYTIKDSFPLPRIEECLDTLSGNEFFSSLDLSSGYWQIEIEPADRHKTAFATKSGFFQYKRLAQGLCNGPATFLRAMQLVLHGMLWEEALAYLDDVMAMGPTFLEGLVTLVKILGRFRQYNLKLSPDKCHLFQKEVLFLGHLVSPEGIRVNPEHTKAIRTWAIPQTIRDIESFCSFLSYHRRHIKHLAEHADRLYQLTKGKGLKLNKDGKWVVRSGRTALITMDDEHIASFELLKQALIDAPILPYPDLEHTFILDTTIPVYIRFTNYFHKTKNENCFLWLKASS